MLKYCTLLVLIFMITGCGVYSFTGASIPPGMKKIKVYIFENEADFVEPNFTDILTENIKVRLRKNFGLIITQDEDEAQGFLRASITTYAFKPNLVSSTGISDSQRLTVGLTLNFSNSIDETFDYSGDITKTHDFNGIYENEKLIILDEIEKQITDEIIEKLFARW